MGNTVPFLSRSSDLPPIRLIDFEIFKTFRQFPRYPDNANATCTLQSIKRQDSFVVFISHCWLRGWHGADGWDGRPHPDNAAHEKFRLCVDGITAMKNALAPGLSHCYVWLDFGCINQDGDPAGELKQLDKIVEACDCIFTPIVDPTAPSWQLPTTTTNYFFDYAASAWNAGPQSYLHRGWCRVEMFYAANIPVDRMLAWSKAAKLKAGLRYAMESKRRPHYLYGTKEWSGYRLPITLAPLQNSYYEEWHPLKGSLTKQQDKAKIQELVDSLAGYMKWAQVGYKGGLDDAGRRHGVGRIVYDTGDEYEGDWSEGQRQGQGRFAYTNGDVYVGEWRGDKRHGQGRCTFANGNLYEGLWADDEMCGQGHLEYATGEVYDGEFLHGLRHGEGTCVYTSKHAYSGHWVADKRDGFGTYSIPSGSPVEGQWLNDALVEQTKHAVFDASIDMAAVTPDNKFHTIYELLDVIAQEAHNGVGIYTPKYAKNKITNEVVRVRCYEPNLEPKKILDLHCEVHMHKIEVGRVPNVLRCLGYYEEKGGKDRFLVLENPEGGELFDRIVARKAYSESKSREVVIKLLHVVLQLHNRHIVHRSIAPEAIFLRSKDDDTDILLGDFVFAIKTTGNASMKTACGIPSYVAPEILSKQPYSLACDMWSVGIVTYVLLCGYSPFYDEKNDELFRKIKSGRFHFHSDYWGSVSEQAQSFVSSLLVVDPARRATVSEALQHPWIIGPTD